MKVEMSDHKCRQTNRPLLKYSKIYEKFKIQQYEQYKQQQADYKESQQAIIGEKISTNTQLNIENDANVLSVNFSSGLNGIQVKEVPSTQTTIEINLPNNQPAVIQLCKDQTAAHITVNSTLPEKPLLQQQQQIGQQWLSLRNVVKAKNVIERNFARQRQQQKGLYHQYKGYSKQINGRFSGNLLNNTNTANTNMNSAAAADDDDDDGAGTESPTTETISTRTLTSSTLPFLELPLTRGADFQSAISSHQARNVNSTNQPLCCNTASAQQTKQRPTLIHRSVMVDKCSCNIICKTTCNTICSLNPYKLDQNNQSETIKFQPSTNSTINLRTYFPSSNTSIIHMVQAVIRHALLFILIFAISIDSQILVTATSASVLNKHEPMFISRSETFKFVAGDTIVLPCEVANTDPYVVAWKRGIAILTAGSVKVTPDPRVRLVNGFNLQIRDAVPQDAGDYICQIATMEPREISHIVEILVPPRIHHISTSGHLQVKKGSSVRIECSASGNPTPNVTWSRRNNILPSGEEKLHSHILSIENVDRHKGGVYICTANNGVGQPASSQVVLHVLYPPEITVERPTVFSGEGHEAMLVCIVHGETQPEVIWFKDTMQLDTTERHIMENRGSRHTLIIRKVHPQDFGNYSCVAENQLGKSRKTLQLSGKPNVAIFNSPPISQYKDRYNISWMVESHTPIEEYKLSFRRMQQGQEVENGIDATHSGASSIMQMYGNNGESGLMNVNHNYRLGGMNGLGGGMGGMSGMGGLSTGSFGNYGFGNMMHWGRNDWRDVVLPAMPLSHHYTQGMSYMIRGLDPDQHYEATVQARNRYGWSEYSRSFVFSTSSNDGLSDLSIYLNHDHLSDNEMRDLSVTFYGGQACLTCRPTILATVIIGLTVACISKIHLFKGFA